jgi:NAD(P)-dependent dehydrogenase (short-subunit alcohol dehydrogenase family)
MDLHLKGRKVLITGASQGMGEGIAYAFAAEGCELYLVARSAQNMDRVAAHARETGAIVHARALDLTERGAWGEVMNFAGDADVLVNNAGVVPAGNLWEVDEAKWRAGWELKLFGYINSCRLMYDAMKKRGGGVILNNIGHSGQVLDFNYIAGSTGNAALMAFTSALGGRSLEDKVRVIGINTGPVSTPRVVKVLSSHAEKLLGDASRQSELMAKYPLGRPATVEEAAALFVFLASDVSSYTSGTIVTLDGGIASKRSVG